MEDLTERLQRIQVRLVEITTALADAETDDTWAADLAAEAARLTAEAAREADVAIERLNRS